MSPDGLLTKLLADSISFLFFALYFQSEVACLQFYKNILPSSIFFSKIYFLPFPLQFFFWNFFKPMLTYINLPSIPSIVVGQSLSCFQFFATPWIAACQPSLPFTVSQSLLKLMFIELMMSSNRLILCRPPLLLSSSFTSISAIYFMSLSLTLHPGRFP